MKKNEILSLEALVVLLIVSVVIFFSVMIYKAIQLDNACKSRGMNYVYTEIRGRTDCYKIDVAE